jgi:D-psicose/D-tagatose/L-ribulose 3-epimerase
MRFAVHTLLWAVEFTEAELPLLTEIRAAGFDGVEIPVFDPRAFRADPIRRGLEDQGLDCIVCSVMPRGLSLLSEDRTAREGALQHLRDAIDVARQMNSRIVAGPLYAPVGYLPGHRRTDDEWQRAVDAYQSVGDLLTESDVTLAIEPLNRFETYFLNTSSDAAALCQAVDHPRIGILYDTFHSNIEDKHPAAAIRLLGPHVKHVHTNENDRGTPGTGHVDWPGVFAALRDIGYDGWLCIESFAPNLGAFTAAVCIWRDIEQSHDAIAFDGIEFLKRQVSRQS